MQLSEKTKNKLKGVMPVTKEEREDALASACMQVKRVLPEFTTKFYKVDKARTREYGGSGIGLSIVRAIMDSFHQKCGVINHEDGVEFWFELETNNGNFSVDKSYQKC